MFSEIVDRIVEESHRGDRRNAIVASLNDIIQRIHSKVNYDRDKYEVRAENLVADCKLIWPRPRNMRKVGVAFINGDPNRQPEFMNVDSKFARVDWDYYYYADESFVFCGDGIHCVNIMYFAKPPMFKYYPKGQRPAVWDCDANRGEGQWKYLTPDGKAYVEGLKAEDMAWARYRVTDWLLEEYPNVLFWGGLNQLTSLTDDETLKRSSYALFETGVADIKRDNTCSALE